MPTITLEQLENASRDADDLAAIVNGDDTTTVPLRLGGSVPSIAKMQADLSNAALVTGPYIISCIWNGTIPANTILIHALATSVGFQLPINLTGSQFRARTASAVDRAIALYKRVAGTTVDTAIGTITFPAGNRIATFTFAAPVSFASGDALYGVYGATLDASLADIAGSLLGSKVES